MKHKIAILDDYQQVALSFADWTKVQQHAEIDVFSDHLFEESTLIERLQPYSVLCVMRERTPLPHTLLEKLPRLRLIVSTGSRNLSIDETAAGDLEIKVQHTGYVTTGAPELTWALLMAIVRRIPQENGNVRKGGWQTTIGTGLAGKTIGIIGLGRIGSKIATYAKAFDMRVIAWSEHLTKKRADEAGAELVSKEDLCKQADFVTIHLVLSDRSRNIISEKELSLMKPGAYLINTSRGPLIDERALVDVLKRKAIAGAALDVFDTEPLPLNHPFRTMDNVLATPHIGYVTEETYHVFFRDTVTAIEAWLKEQNP